MPASIINSSVYDPPVPGGRYPVEYVTACFDASGTTSVTTSHSFSASFSSTPSMLGGGNGGWGGSVTPSLGPVAASNLSSAGVSFFAKSNDGAAASFKTKTTFMFSE